ncbi:uncharacterized protein LOC130893837 [Diorhabda carinulata]|uniref:uncharacterized protein LOC130893837 n=1 Tax=Diorhabda carinulata TaxID=1163345 RepID=UPI0025A033C4|nr:uncharacterized protein LOC130893837 [Diorhabda carinulata]
MGLRYIFFCVLLFYISNARVIEETCPSYCVCDIINDYRRATCQSKNLITVEIAISPLVEYLDLSHNHISDLNRQVFSDLHLTELKWLNLSYNKISQIDLYAFEGLEQLTSLDLSYNRIQYFLDQWWLSLNNLKELYLRGNSLASINSQPPISLPELKILDLSDNKVANFHTIVFENIPNVEVLDISDNYLINIHAELFKPITKLKLLIANGISLNCKDRSTLLLEQYIEGNNISYVGPCKKEDKIDNAAPKFERMMMLNEDTTKQEKLEAADVIPRSSNSKRNSIPQIENEKKNKYKTAWKQWEISKDITDAALKKKKIFNGVNAAKNSWSLNDRKFQKVGAFGSDKNCAGSPNLENIKIDSFGSFFKYIAAKISLASPGGAAVLSGVCGFIIGVFTGQTQKGQVITKKLKVVLKKFIPFVLKFIPGVPFISDTSRNLNSNDDQGGDEKDGKPGKKKQKNEEKTKKTKKNNKGEDEEHLIEDLDKHNDEGDEVLVDEDIKTKRKFKRGTRHSVEDRVYLLDEEEILDGSTPAMKKKDRSLHEYRIKKEFNTDESKLKKSDIPGPNEKGNRTTKFIWERGIEKEQSDDSEEEVEELKSRSSLSGPSSRLVRKPDTDKILESDDSSPSITKEDEDKTND